MALSGYLADLIEIFDGLYLEDPQPGSEQARRRDELLGLCPPASVRRVTRPATALRP
jgi:hypothetical protein